VSSSRFQGLRILVVEDEYLIAIELADWLQDAGAEVVGPVGTVSQAMSFIADPAGKLAAATLDINLGGARDFPVADALRAKGIPFVFCTGYDLQRIPQAYRQEQCLEKPIDRAKFMDALTRELAARR
jgi:CheY-like chemotaxis protein